MNPPTTFHYTLSAEQQQRFADIYLLRRMINEPLAISVDLSGDNSFVEPILTRLCEKGWVTINTKKALYVPTEAGREPLKKFEQRYYDYLQVYDLYNSVDLEQGDFGCSLEGYFSTRQGMFELLRQERWRPFLGEFQDFVSVKVWRDQDRKTAFSTFLNLEPWKDLRVAVTEYKKLDALEVVFMSLLNEGHFDKPQQSWQFDLHAGWFFRKVENIANSAIHMDQILADGYTSEELMQNIISAGTDIMLQLIMQQEEYEKQRAAEQAQALEQANQTRADQQPQTQTLVTTTVEVVEEVSYVTVVEPVYYTRGYYNVYLNDPYYVAPIWYDPWYW